MNISEFLVGEEEPVCPWCIGIEVDYVRPGKVAGEEDVYHIWGGEVLDGNDALGELFISTHSCGHRSTTVGFCHPRMR